MNTHANTTLAAAIAEARTAAKCRVVVIEAEAVMPWNLETLTQVMRLCDADMRVLILAPNHSKDEFTAGDFADTWQAWARRFRSNFQIGIDFAHLGLRQLGRFGDGSLRDPSTFITVYTREWYEEKGRYATPELLCDDAFGMVSCEVRMMKDGLREVFSRKAVRALVDPDPAMQKAVQSVYYVDAEGVCEFHLPWAE